MFDTLTSKGQWLMLISPNKSGPHYVVVDGIENDIVTVLDSWRLKKPGIDLGLEATIAMDKLLEHWINDFGFVFPYELK